MPYAPLGTKRNDNDDDCHQQYSQLVHHHHNFFNFVPAPTATLIAPKAGLYRNYVHLICRVTGTPEPSITWYQNGVVLSKRARALKFRIPGGELLRLLRLLERHHVGDYMCKASNADGTATSQTTSLKIYRG